MAAWEVETVADGSLLASASDASSPLSSSSPPGGSSPRGYYSLRLSLLFLVAMCVLPALLVSAYLVNANYQLKKQTVYGETLGLARQIAADLERELSGIESALKVLATSEALHADDLKRFHQVARDALQSQVVYNYVMTDAAGRQVLNTLRPWGDVLPEGGTPEQLQEVFRSGRTVLADLFRGPVTGRPALAMGVPVYRDAEIIYSLNVGLAPDRINEILRRQPLPPGWLVAILDSKGTIVGRSRDADRYIGQQAVPQVLSALRASPQGSLETVTKEGQAVVTSHLRSAPWGWTVVIGAPQQIVEAQLYRMLPWLLLVLGLFMLGLWQAVRLANRVVDSVQQLNSAALALGQGRPVNLPGVQLREAEAVGQAIVQASHLMAEVHHRAYHDALTGLANRDLFLELVQFQIAAAQRDQGRLAVLALDLDHFKQVNDEEGHARGDQLLRDVASRITGTIRGSDVAARSGGDEFWVLLCDADEASAIETAKRLLAALRQAYPGVRAPVSASIGIAVYPGAGEEPQALLEAADHALYAAKRAGRDTFAQAPR